MRVRRECRGSGDRAGLTFLEVMMAVALISIVSVKAYDVLSTAGRSTESQTQVIVLEDQARRVMRQIGYAIMGANRETLIPDTPAPIGSDDLRFQVNLGIQDGEVVWSDPEQVALETTRSQVFWSQNPGGEDERRVVWTSLVAPYLEGELPNGMDDNGNGLIDEKGLNFVVDRNSVRIRLTLERVSDEGDVITNTVETTVTCRNLPEAEE